MCKERKSKKCEGRSSERKSENLVKELCEEIHCEKICKKKERVKNIVKL